MCHWGVCVWGVRVTVQRLKYSRIISSREANRMGRFQYPGDSKSPSKRVSSLIMSSISRRDFVGGVGVAVFDLVNALYFCFASTYLYRKSRSIHATANATHQHHLRNGEVPSVATSTLFNSYAYAK
jgi:hypothetical protein